MKNIRIQTDYFGFIKRHKTIMKTVIQRKVEEKKNRNRMIVNGWTVSRNGLDST